MIKLKNILNEATIKPVKINKLKKELLNDREMGLGYGENGLTKYQVNAIIDLLWKYKLVEK
tara:strand:- start:68 stop:250 length:183 start_codon:yes stop_codon:yes gene_type:complete